MNKFLFVVVILMMGVSDLLGDEPQLVTKFERSGGFTPANRIDSLVVAGLRKQGIKPANLCSDEVFVRRAYLDVTGTLPTAQEVRQFLDDENPAKRAALIETLFKRQEFADYWALKWCDLLRVKAEFPINLWPNAVQAYHHWIREAIKDNMPYDQFARELLTASGSNFRTPQANFYRAIQGRDPCSIAQAVALTFMGVRTDKWPQARRYDMAFFFSRLAYKSTGEWKEEIVYVNPKASGPVEAVLPDGVKVRVSPEQDPRKVFTDWLVSPQNPWFARNAVNRIWSWLMGRGIIQEPDDIRPDNPASNPELLAYLERELINSKYDLRHIYRLILNSNTYQQSCIPQSSVPNAEALFAYYPVRRLDAEVLIDALCSVTGMGENYTSPIPEPFTYIPSNQRTIALADGSITSSFLEMFGRPARDSGLESERNNQPNDAQRLHLLNSSHIQQKIDRSWRTSKLLEMAGRNRSEVVRWTYLSILSRYPTEDELAAAEKYFGGKGISPRQAEDDLVWALINTKEFLYRH